MTRRYYTDEAGRPVSHGLLSVVLRFIDNHVNDTSRTLETGAGVSTVLFALKGTCHTCIVPDQDQVKRITNYCTEHQISVQKIDFRIDKSETVLPRLERDGYDLVVIDGRHAFPTPFIDWYYASDKLKVGGLVIVDDTHLWTGDVLKQFLLSGPEWRLKQDFPPRSSVFTKVREGSHEREWNQQTYVAAASLDLYPENIDILGPHVSEELLTARRSRIRRFLRRVAKKILKEL